jgi:acyl-CoA synthetase (AMP-forming)/AMP-acid ligase II
MASDEHLAEIAGGPIVNKTSVFAHIEQGLLKIPHEPAVICMHQPSDHLSNWVPVDHEFQQRSSDRIDCLTLTYTQLHRGALILAAGIAANGVSPGARILIIIPNGGEYSLLLWTCTIMRLTFAALDPSALEQSGRTQLRSFLETFKPGLVVVPNEAGARAVDDAIEDSVPTKILRVSLGIDDSRRWKSLLDLAADASNPSALDQNKLLEDSRNDEPQRIYSVLFTSGTSAGRPKGCPRRVDAMTHWLHSQSWLINEENGAKVLQQADISRAISPALMLQTWREGGTVVLPGTRSFAIEDTIQAILKQRVTFIVLSPAMVYALAEALASYHPSKLDSVRTIHLGGEAVTRDVLLKCATLFPSAKVCLNHGMTEGGGFFTWPFFDCPLSQIPSFGEICPIGVVAPGARVRIWDTEKSCVAKRGQPGELHVNCESIIEHYLGGAMEPSSSFYTDEKGRWFNIGDHGIMDDEGLIFILGRSKDVIKRGGVSIMPAVLESCIEKYTSAQVSIRYP